MNHGIFTRAARNIAKNATDLPSTYEAFGLLDDAYLQAEPHEKTEKSYRKTYRTLDKKLSELDKHFHAADV
ncbi:hypothetical protein ACVFI8_00040 [Agarivorans sp. MS3-6]